MKNIKLILLTLVSVFCLSASSYAWDYKVEEPDVFGVKKFFAQDAKLRESLVVQCDSKGFMAIAYIFKIKQFSEIEKLTAKLFVKGNSDSPIVVDAVRSKWNDNYGGIVAIGENNETNLLIQEIRDAKKNIQVGVQIGGNQFSASFSSRGSTKSMKAAITACNLNIPG